MAQVTFGLAIGPWQVGVCGGRASVGMTGRRSAQRFRVVVSPQTPVLGWVGQVIAGCGGGRLTVLSRSVEVASQVQSWGKCWIRRRAERAIRAGSAVSSVFWTAPIAVLDQRHDRPELHNRGHRITLPDVNHSSLIAPLMLYLPPCV